ncbi:MAG TPA: hypothetical protein VFV34_21195, partial [Blastocatellia bacterium]|nr:hypothetical protein [Blastocatellia bacterium]
MLITVMTLATGISASTTIAADQLIPRRLLFADEDKLNVRLRPDGTSLTYIAPVDGADGVWMCPVDDPAKATLLFKQADAPVLNLQWAYTSRHLVYLKPVAKDVHLFVFDLIDRRPRDLTPQAGSARIEKLSPAHPEEILIGLNGRDPTRYDLYRINLLTGETKLVLKNDEYDQFLCDDEFRPRVARRRTIEQGYVLLRLNATGQWELLDRFSYEEARISQPAALDRAGTTLYLVDNRRTNTAVLRAVDLASGKARTLVADTLADLRASLLFDPRTGAVQSATAVYGRTRRHFLDPSIAADFKYLHTVHAGDVGVAGRSIDDRVWLVVFQNGGPLRYFVYHRP